MLFNSYIFIFLFLPMVLVLWYGLNFLKKYTAAQVVVVVMSFWFYGYFNPSYIWIIIGSVIGNWTVSFLIKKFAETDTYKNRRVFLGTVGIVFNLGVLFYYKYYDFFVSNLNVIFKQDWALRNIMLPLGISFFTFQQISFMADRMKGTAEHYNILDYAMFVTYFPQLIAGPIVCHRDLVPQFKDLSKRCINSTNLLMGIRIFVIGLGKKVLIADMLGKVADAAFGAPELLDTAGAILGLLSYTFQMYFDFSGYCDMAIGLGYMMNIGLPMNFNSPYKACSIREFWKRWHMTLNAFFTEYVYIPLGGSRCAKWKHLRNVLIVFLLSGIWHGANWTFVIWGICHGLLIVFENLAPGKWIEKHCPRILRWFGTFVAIMLLFVLFRSDSMESALVYYNKIFSWTNTESLWRLSSYIADFKTYILHELVVKLGGDFAGWVFYLCVFLVLLAFAAFLCTRENPIVRVREKTATRKEMWVLAFVFALSVISLSGVSRFLYFNF